MAKFEAPSPRLSVIIPVFNADAYLARCLASVLGQTFKDIEVICVDDKSADASCSIIEELKKKDKRLKLLKSSEKIYDCGARQLGLDAARGKYVYFMDSDDWIDPDFLEAMLRQIEDNGCNQVINANYVKEWLSPAKQAASTDFGFLKETSGFYPSRTVQSLFPPVVWARLWRRDYLVRNRIRWAPIPNAADVAFTGLGTVIEDNVFIFRGPAYHYIQHPDSLMNQQGRGFLDLMSFNSLYDELKDRRIGTKGMRLFYLGPVLILDSQHFDLLKSFFTKVKDEIRRESGLYVAHDLFVMDSVLDCKDYGEWTERFGASTLNAFIRKKALKS